MAAGASGGEWEKHVDKTSSSTYYYNTRTGLSSWEAPADFKSPREEDAIADKAPRWREFVDDKSGATYYYDEVSGTSRWDKPEEFLAVQDSVELNKAKETQESEEQEETELQKVGTTEETEALEQEPQGGKKDNGKSSGSKTESSEKETGETIENIASSVKRQLWVRYVDAATSKPYYCNASTGKTQWEEPDDFNEPGSVLAAPQVSAEYQVHLNRIHTERMVRVTQQVLDPSGNLSKLSAILSDIDRSAPSDAATANREVVAEAPLTVKAEWQQHIDAQTQRYYYHNVVTGVTQWNKPDAPIVSGLADWIPPEVSGSDSTGASQKTVSGVNYVTRAKFNRLTGKYEQLDVDEYWEKAGIAPDRAGRQMSHFFDMTELEKNREEARRRKEQLKRRHIDWKKITAEKKAKKQKQRNEWLYTD